MQATHQAIGTAEASTARGAEQDLGPLAWVLDELRKTMDAAAKALRRYLRESDAGLVTGFTAPDVDHLQQARQSLHQCSGALDMIGQPVPAQLLRAMEAATQRFADQPALCTDEAISRVERASFAVADYLEAVLAGKPVSAVGLFPQYRDVQTVAGSDRIHPADLWRIDWSWQVPDGDGAVPLPYAPAVRGRLDQAVLKTVKSGDPQAARELQVLSLGLAAGTEGAPQQSFWSISAAYFQALSLGLVPSDLYAKRIASRLLTQYAALARGDALPAERLAQDMLFYCAGAVPPADSDAGALRAVRAAYGLAQAQPVDYEQRRFGRFDPAHLAQARKRIAAATETWSALAGGDTHKFKPAIDQFAMVGESLTRLHPDSGVLAQALNRAVDATARAGQVPSAPLAMEVATAVLYLEAAYEELDQADADMQARAQQLASRLERVLHGGEPEPLEPWMEELYHRVSDRQTMGSVVEELGKALAEVEQSLDQFFRAPREKVVLGKVTSQLSQMRGVLSVLGLDQASHAVMRMRETVDGYMADIPSDPEARTTSFDRLGSSLGALGFLIDMLSYQRALAKKLFVYDEEQGLFRPVMGRQNAAVARPPADEAPAAEPAPAPAPAPQAPEPPQASADLLEQAAQALTDLPPLPPVVALEPAPEPDTAPPAMPPEPQAPAPAPLLAEPHATLEGEEDDEELRGIFLDEAREVVQNGLAATAALAAAPQDLTQQTTLRRAFHTLKGSARMVGLSAFGEAAWAMEQLLNAWLAEQKPATAALRDLAHETLQAFGRWTEDIAAGQADAWQAAPFRASADALRLQQRSEPLQVPGAAPAATPQPEPAPAATLPVPAAEPDEVVAVLDAAPATASAPPEPTALPLPIDMAPDDAADAQPDFQETTHFLLFPEEDAPTSALPLIELDWPEPATPTGVLDLSLPLPETTQPPLAETATPEDWAAGDTVWSPSIPASQDDAVVPVDAAGLDYPFLDPEDNVKVIGPLRIGLPLYNVYLNEADEWSRQLLNELGEWALQLPQPVAESTIGLAHSLAGSSATVGFEDLSHLARLLEHTLGHVQLLGPGEPHQARVFVDAAEDIRRLLHQFAAGFLKTPYPPIVQALQDILQANPVPSAAAPLGDAVPDEDLDVEPSDSVLAFFDLPGETPPAPVQDAAPPAEAAPETDAPPEQPVEQVEPAEAVDAVEAVEAVDTALETPAATGSVVPDAGFDEDIDEEIDVVDTVDLDLFPIFDEEAAELLPSLGGALRQWSARPADTAARGEALRALHTLKGSARLAGALRLGERAHRLETAIERLGSEDVPAALIDRLLGHFDTLQADLDQLRSTQQQTSVEAEASASAADASTPVAAADEALAAAVPMAPVPAPGLRPMAGHTVRVRSQLLDRLVNQTGEVMITRARLEARLSQLSGALGELTGNLERLRTQLRELEVQAESQMQSRLAQAKESAQGFDPLEFDRFTRVQELTRMMAESVNDVATVQRTLQRTIEGTEDDLVAQARQARDMQHDLLRTRMLEFESIAERLYGVVRQATKDSGRQVRLDITGGSIELDRGVLDRIVPAFEHLLRNAIAHGIEPPEERVAAGKAATGAITIALGHEANDISVSFQDDGRGLDLGRIQAKALSLGLLSSGSLLSPAEAADLIFLPGFSTATQVTGLAGRGIGMDVVRTEVQALGGRIATETTPGQGTRFSIVLPLTTAVTQVVMLRAGDRTIGVPTNLVEAVRRVPLQELAQTYRDESYQVDGQAVPFFWAGALLQSSAGSSEPPRKFGTLVVLRSAAQRLALHVDEVLGNQEVVVKNLGPQLARLPGLAGMSVLASGAVVLIYNPVALATVYGAQARQAQQDRALRSGDGGPASVLPAVAEVPLVLVVDDSITVRRVTQRLLKREGYRVTLAADGLQALEQLQQEVPALVLSDIEMPRMDGFDLARNIRSDARWKDLPIIMITSRMAEKHREHAQSLGVNHYLGKPYPEEELLSLVRRYTTPLVDAS